MNKKLNLLHVLWSGGIGGTEEYILTLIKHSDHSKYQINVCFLSDEGLMLEEARKLKGVNVIFIGIKNGFDVIGALEFAFFLLRGRFDIIHSHMRNFLSTLILISFAFNVPKVLTHHIGPVDLKIFKKNKLFYKLFSVFFREITAISEMVKANVVDDFGVSPANKVKVVYNGIDLNKYSESNIISPDIRNIRQPGRFIFGFVGRMEYFKRPRLFVEIATELLKQSKRFYFVMVGDGPELDECREMLDQNGIGEYFSLLGYRRDIPNIIKLFDVLLFTSFSEGFGLVILEAMAMGVPVFAINDGAVPEIITHKGNGILFDTSESGTISELIMEAIEDGKSLDRMKEQCKKDVRSRFGIHNCVSGFENIYNEVAVK